MAEWILILTLFQSHSYGGSAVSTVTGFESRAACLQAGNAWLKQARRLRIEGMGAPSAGALCVMRK